MIDVCVIGAGVSGLAAATFLEEAGLSVQVWEANPKPGGNVRSDIHDGRVLDRAANGWLDNEPAMGRLLDLVGLTPRLVSPTDQFGTRWILADGRMQAAPLGPKALLGTDLLTTGAKLRALLEPVMPRGASAQAHDPTVDESVGDRAASLGPAFVDRMVGPMVAGIYATDPDERRCAARFTASSRWSASIAALCWPWCGAPLRWRPAASSRLSWWRRRALDHHGTTPRTPTHMRPTRHGTRKTPDGWQVRAVDAGGEEHVQHARRVILACPAPAQARIVAAVDPAASKALADIPYGPVVVVCTAWSKESWSIEPEGFGVLLARGESSQIDGIDGVLGMLFTSSIFPDRAGPDEVLIRTILGSIAPEVYQSPTRS